MDSTRARHLALLAFCLTVVVCTSAPVAQSRLARADSSKGAAPVPRAVTPYTSFNFGDVYTGDIISQVFIIRNEGDADLVIREFAAGCACTAVSSDKVIGPGKVGTATLEVQTVSQQGGLLKIATMRTNDPERPNIDFSLIANVLRGTPLRQGKYVGPIFLSPDARLAMYALPGKTAKVEFSLTADNTPVKILKVEVGSKDFLSRVDEIEPGKRYKSTLR